MKFNTKNGRRSKSLPGGRTKVPTSNAGTTNKAAVKARAAKTVDSIMAVLIKLHKQLLKRGDELFRNFPETEALVRDAITTIVHEAIATAPKNKHRAFARAALASASQYIRGTIAEPEFVKSSTVDAVVDSAASIASARNSEKDDVFAPALTRGEVADVCLSAAGVLYTSVIPKKVPAAGGTPPTGPARPEPVTGYDESLTQFARVISSQKLDPRSVSLGTSLIAELQPLQVVAEFIRQRVDVVRDAAHPLANSNSSEISIARRCAVRAERLIRPFIADDGDIWQPLRHHPDTEDAIADTLTGLCHLGEALGLDVDELLERGASNFRTESREGPDVYRTLSSARRTPTQCSKLTA